MVKDGAENCVNLFHLFVTSSALKSYAVSWRLGRMRA